MCRRSRSPSKGFSLVEVSIAIGIAAFGIISLLGLMGVFLSSGRESHEDTILSDIAKGVFADLRSRPFDPPAQTNPPAFDHSLKSLSGSVTTIYFTAEGVSVGTAASAYYSCNLTLKEVPEFNTVSTSAINLYEAKVEFAWPAPQNAFRKTFHINLARYGN